MCVTQNSASEIETVLESKSKLHGDNHDWCLMLTLQMFTTGKSVLKKYIYTFVVLLLFIWSDDISSQIYDWYDMPVKIFRDILLRMIRCSVQMAVRTELIMYFSCLCSVPNGTCAGSGPKISRIAWLHKQSLKSWFHTGSGSTSFSLTCMTSFAKLAFSNALRFPKPQDQRYTPSQWGNYTTI